MWAHASIGPPFENSNITLVENSAKKKQIGEKSYAIVHTVQGVFLLKELKEQFVSSHQPRPWILL